MSEAAVLLVDDRPENLLALRATLEPLGCETVSVTSGEEALKALLQQDFAVVLLDVQMPGMDGFETAELIKGRRRTRAVPIIFVTAISKEPHHVYRGYEAGAVDYLFKPYDPELLKSKVRVFLELDAMARTAARSEALARAAFTRAPIGMARVDLEGRIAEVNDALALLLGRSLAELRDRRFDTIVAEADRGRLPEPGVPADESVSVRLLTANAEELPVVLTYAVAHPGLGLPAALIVSVQDERARLAARVEREGRIREQVARAEAERSSVTLRALQAVSDAAMAPSSPDALVGELLNRIADALEADTATVVLDTDEGRVVHQAAGAPGDGGPRWYSVVSSAGQDGPAEHDSMSSALTAPLTAGGETLGVLRVGSLFAREFTDDDRHLLRLAADRAALAIQRARVQERDHALAEELQLSLLPAALPEVRGTAAAARYFPGGAGERVGGDWYDVVPVAPGRVLLMIGDVAGHGIGAASHMGQLRSALRAYALDGHGPAALLERLNAFQIGMDLSGMTTVAAVAIDLNARTVTHARAGHLPPLLADGAGKRSWLEDALGPPLGAIPDYAYGEAELALPTDATVVLYTDGLVELRGELLDEGLGRLWNAFDDAPEDVEALCDTLLRRTLPSVGTAEDDVTLLVLRAVGERRRRERRRRREAPEVAVPSARLLASGTWPHRPDRAARVELPRREDAGAAARTVVRETLTGWIATAELDTVLAVVSEVVNNAVEHGAGDGPVIVHVAAAPAVLRAEVSSTGPTFDPPTPSPVDEPGGFGLVIIDRMTTRWGIDFEDGVCVWFELDRTG